MATDRLEQRLSRQGGSQNHTLLPYFTAGFPDGDTTSELIRRADALGVAAVELGLAYSDSIADGPVIQSSFHHVLRQGFTTRDTFDLVSRVRPSISCGLVAMLSYSIVHRVGLAVFMEQAASAGFDGVILPDVPVEESGPCTAAAHSAGLCHIGLVAPTTSPTRREAIARQSSGFIYKIAVAGTTGERMTLPAGLAQEVAELKHVSGLPVCVGFGISRPRHVREVCAFADGAIVGSAIIRRIADALDEGQTLAAIVESVSRFLSDLMAGAP